MTLRLLSTLKFPPHPSLLPLFRGRGRGGFEMLFRILGIPLAGNYFLWGKEAVDWFGPRIHPPLRGGDPPVAKRGVGCVLRRLSADVASRLAD